MALRLLSFDDPAGPSAAGPSADWCAGHRAGHADGYAEGLAAAREEAAVAGARADADLAQALRDLAFTQAEAREAVLAGLGPFLRTVAEAVLPPLAEAAWAPLLADRLLAAARADAAATLVLVVHPDVLPHLAPHLGSRAGPPLIDRVETDAALPPGTARLAAGPRETLFDAAACLAEVTAAIAHLTPTEARRHA